MINLKRFSCYCWQWWHTGCGKQLNQFFKCCSLFKQNWRSNYKVFLPETASFSNIFFVYPSSIWIQSVCLPRVIPSKYSLEMMTKSFPPLKVFKETWCSSLSVWWDQLLLFFSCCLSRHVSLDSHDLCCSKFFLLTILLSMSFLWWDNARSAWNFTLISNIFLSKVYLWWYIISRHSLLPYPYSYYLWE